MLLYGLTCSSYVSGTSLNVKTHYQLNIIPSNCRVHFPCTSKCVADQIYVLDIYFVVYVFDVLVVVFTFIYFTIWVTLPGNIYLYNYTYTVLI